MPNPTLPVLPAILSFLVNGATVKVQSKPNKERTRIWYGGGVTIKRFVKDLSLVEGLLNAMTVGVNGVELKASNPAHLSEPSVYPKGHAKEGQVKPNTGGNWTRTAAGSITLKDIEGDEHRFTAMVTVTYLPQKGFKVNARAIPQASAATAEIEGDLFAGVESDAFVEA